jgi:molybdate transport system permease protein
MSTISWKEFVSPIWLSLQVSVVSSVIVFILGLLAARMMTKKVIRGRLWIDTLFMLPLVLPPTVVGFILLVVLGRRSFIGEAIEYLFQQPIIFTWGAAVVATVVVSFPLVYQTMKVGFQSVDRDLEDAGRSIGASEWQVLWHITLPLASRSLFVAYLLGFARGLGEFGATLMVAGNIPMKTQTLPTAIYVAADTGNLPLAWLWTIAIMIISFLLLVIINLKKG